MDLTALFQELKNGKPQLSFKAAKTLADILTPLELRPDDYLPADPIVAICTTIKQGIIACDETDYFFDEFLTRTQLQFEEAKEFLAIAEKAIEKKQIQPRFIEDMALTKREFSRHFNPGYAVREIGNTN